jgi:endonuclease/exonuclease/phosphatase family metal-dependent hydrolase
MLLNGAAVAITVVAAGLLVCAYLARYIDPNRAWPFAFAGMAAPALYVANLALALYWTIRWRWYALVPMAVVVLGVGWVSLFFKPTLGKHRPTERSSDAITVMSYNVAGFLSSRETGPRRSILDSVTALVRRQEPDILCIQEFQSNDAAGKPHIDSLLALPREVHHYSVANTAGGGWGLAIYTRYKILDSGVVDFEGTTNSAMWADLSVDNDTLRVFNCHLQTTSINQEDLDRIEEFHTEGSRVRSMVARLRRNFRIRAVQADTLAPLIVSSPHPVVVCGDFNDTPMSYAYRRIRGPLSDSFVERGHGIPNTYRGLFNLLRIDYIFHSPALRTVYYDIPQSDLSDHEPVVAQIAVGR